MADEVELKFDVDPVGAAQLCASPVLAAANASRTSSQTLYYDTADGAPCAAGISLQVRRTGGPNVQTRKRGEVAGLFIREDRFVTALKGLQDELGRASDARSANEVAARLASDTPPVPVPARPVRRAERAFHRAAAAAGYRRKGHGEAQ